VPTIDDALRVLREHSASNLGDGETEAVIAAAEEALGCRIPESYRRFLGELGYAEVHGDELYSIYDVPPDHACLGIVHQNAGEQHLSDGYLAFLSTDIDGLFMFRLSDGSVYLNGPDQRVAESFEALVVSLVGGNT